MKRKPDFVVERDGIAYLNRWYVWRRNRWLNCYLHEFIADDVDPVLHDHPWWSVSVVLRGGYYEITTGPDGTQERRYYGRGSVRIRSAKFSHRIELPRVKRFDGEKTVEVLEPCWTLFLTGPRIRDWGFHCPNGWKSWQEYCEPVNPGRVGKGCGE